VKLGLYKFFDGWENRSDLEKKKFYHYKYKRFQCSYSRANPSYARLENQSHSNNKYIIYLIYLLISCQFTYEKINPAEGISFLKI